jgi:hypothetical protein
MADEITVIGIGVDTSQVEKGAADLDKLAAAGGRAEASAQKLESGLSKIELSATIVGTVCIKLFITLGNDIERMLITIDVYIPSIKPIRICFVKINPKIKIIAGSKNNIIYPSIKLF